MYTEIDCDNTNPDPRGGKSDELWKAQWMLTKWAITALLHACSSI